MKNAIELVKEFEREYCREEEEEVRQQEKEDDDKMFRRELLGRYTAKVLYGWGNKKYDREYWRRIGNGGRKICSLGTTKIHS